MPWQTQTAKFIRPISCWIRLEPSTRRLPRWRLQHHPSPWPQRSPAGSAAATSCPTSSSGHAGRGYTPNEVYDIMFSGGGSDPGKVLPVAHATADKYGAIDQGQLYIDSAGAN